MCCLFVLFVCCFLFVVLVAIVHLPKCPPWKINPLKSTDTFDIVKAYWKPYHYLRHPPTKQEQAGFFLVIRRTNTRNDLFSFEKPISVMKPSRSNTVMIPLAIPLAIPRSDAHLSSPATTAAYHPQEHQTSLPTPSTSAGKSLQTPCYTQLVSLCLAASMISKL